MGYAYQSLEEVHAKSLANAERSMKAVSALHEAGLRATAEAESATRSASSLERRLEAARARYSRELTEARTDYRERVDRALAELDRRRELAERDTRAMRRAAAEKKGLLEGDLADLIGLIDAGGDDDQIASLAGSVRSAHLVGVDEVLGAIASVDRDALDRLLGELEGYRTEELLSRIGKRKWANAGWYRITRAEGESALLVAVLEKPADTVTLVTFDTTPEHVFAATVRNDATLLRAPSVDDWNAFAVAALAETTDGSPAIAPVSRVWPVEPGASHQGAEELLQRLPGAERVEFVAGRRAKLPVRDLDRFVAEHRDAAELTTGAHRSIAVQLEMLERAGTEGIAELATDAFGAKESLYRALGAIFSAVVGRDDGAARGLGAYDFGDWGAVAAILLRTTGVDSVQIGQDGTGADVRLTFGGSAPLDPVRGAELTFVNVAQAGTSEQWKLSGYRRLGDEAAEAPTMDAPAAVTGEAAP